MRLALAAVGKVRAGPMADQEAVYRKRLAPHCRLEINEVAHAKASMSEGEQLADEARRLQRHIDRAGLVVAFDRRGRELDSPAFARALDRWRQSGKRVLLLIGGPCGLGKDVMKQTQEVISFSKMTFPHELFRVLLFEQLYRGFMILAGHPYHR